MGKAPPQRGLRMPRRLTDGTITPQFTLEYCPKVNQGVGMVDGSSRINAGGNPMAKSNSQKPGSPARISAQYGIFGPRGGNTGKEVTVPKGHTLPPTPKPGQTYRPVDPTNNKS